MLASVVQWAAVTTHDAAIRVATAMALDQVATHVRDRGRERLVGLADIPNDRLPWRLEGADEPGEDLGE